MKTSPNGIELIKRFEGLELESYQDIAGIWTIGYGHTETAGPNQRITEREAEELLRRDLKSREQAVDNLSNVPLNQNEFDALVSFVYNVGANAFRGSTARRRLNANNRLGAADALTWWNKATVDGVLVAVNGLTRRRAAERALFLTPAQPVTANELTSVTESTRATPIEDPPRRGRLGESRTIQGATVAGGAGVASANMGRDSAEELNELETNIEQGTGLTDGAAGPHDHDHGSGGHDDDHDAGNESNQQPAPADDQPEPVAPEASADDCVPSEHDALDGEVGETEEHHNECDHAGDDADDIVDLDAPGDTGELTESIEQGPPPPSKHEKHAADAQIQLALMVLILLSVVYIIYARLEDWWTFRR